MTLVRENAVKFLFSILLEMCEYVSVKFKVDRLDSFCTEAPQVSTNQKPFPGKIPLTMKTTTSYSL